MLRSLRTGAALAALLSLPASAQLSFVHGPDHAPLGCPVHVTLSNDNPHSIFYDPCGFDVFDAAGQKVYTAPCAGFVQLQPGEVFTHTWPQTDDLGAPVPAGTYFLDDPAGTPVIVGGVETSIAPLGAPKAGTARSLEICSPADPGTAYLMAASTTNAFGIGTCGGVIPLDFDPVFEASVGSASAPFIGFVGSLDGAGRSAAPTLAIPNDAGVLGLSLVLAFAVLDPAAPCAVRRVSVPYVLTIF